MKEQIMHYLPGDHPWQNQIYWYESIDSTNTRAKTAARDGAPHGTVILADSQTCGRGRLGRSFHSPAGSGIYMSVILRPNCPAGQLMHLTCAAAVAACDAVASVIGLRPGIKWTNDLVCGQRKVAGILTELSVNAQTGTVDYAIIGIGINCTQKAEDFPPDIRGFAGSLAMVCEKTVRREQIIAALIDAFSHMELSSKTAIMDAYRQSCITLGQDVSVARGEEVRHGQALSVDEDGGLLVRFSDGHTESVQSGEVSIRGMYGYV